MRILCFSCLELEVDEGGIGTADQEEDRDEKDEKKQEIIDDRRLLPYLREDLPETRKEEEEADEEVEEKVEDIELTDIEAVEAEAFPDEGLDQDLDLTEGLAAERDPADEDQQVCPEDAEYL